MVARKERFMRQRLSPQENKRAWLYAGMIVLCMLAIAGLVWAAPMLEGLAPAGALPGTSQEVLQAADGLDEILVDAVFDPSQKLLTAVQTMVLHNPSGRALEEIVLRSYSGAYLKESTSPAATEELFLSCYGDMFVSGGLTVRTARINGEEAAYTWADEACTVLSLPHAWQKDAAVTVELTYEVRIPDCASRFGVEDDVFALGNVLPTPAVWQDGDFRRDAYIAIGDPFVTECANWHVNLTVPQGCRVAGTGYDPAPVVQDGMATHRLQAQAVRDFALVISPAYEVLTAMAEDVLLIACAKEKGHARSMLKYARQALAGFEKHYGPYGYPTLTVAEVPFPYGGMEYPRMVMIASKALEAGGETLEYTIAHEVAHQWWYGMVGSDSVKEAWQDESLCEYALLDYIGETYGVQARADAAFERIETALRITVPRGVTPGSPIDYFQDLSEYSIVVYRRGAALWLALENLLGKEGLDAALKRYAEEYRFQSATREELTRLLSEQAGMDLTALMQDYLDTYMN